MVDEKNFAVLIDSDNVSFRFLKVILDEVANYGSATYKRIYGDWTSVNANGWKDPLLEYSITPIQQYSYTSGKNSTDSAMIIDAMDILYSGNVDGFCLVSSDSDFTRLAVRLRESGMMVIGMGERKTPKPFCVACNVFKYLDILGADEDEEDEPADTLNSRAGKNDAKESMTDVNTILKSILNIINENCEDERGISIGELGNHLLKRYPDFDVRNYGYTKLSKFLSSFDCLSLETSGRNMHVSVPQSHMELEGVKKAIADFVMSCGNHRTNMGQLSQWLIVAYPNFNIKNYGYASFVKFLNDIEGITVRSSGRYGRTKSVIYKPEKISSPTEEI